MEDSLIYYGGAVKALEGEPGLVGGLAVRHKDETRKDFAGDFFDAETYLGAREGDGCDVLFHHGQPIGKGFEEFTEHIFAPVKAKRDKLGLFVEHVLDLSDAFEKKVYELVKAGKLSYSTGSAGHMVKRDANGHLKRWPIIEVSLTPTPCDFENKVIPIKSLSAVKHVALDDAEPEVIPAPAAKAVDGERLFTESLRQTEQQTWELWSAVQTGVRKIVDAALARDVTGVDVDVRQAVTALVGAYSPKLTEAIVSQVTDYLGAEVRDEHFYLKSIFDELISLSAEVESAATLEASSRMVVSACGEHVAQTSRLAEAVKAFAERGREKARFRTETKAGRVFSQTNLDRMAEVHSQMQSLSERLGEMMSALTSMMEMAKPKEEAKTASLAALRMQTLRLESQVAGVPLRG